MMSDSEQRIVQGVIDGLTAKGLTVVTADLADYALQRKKAVDRLLSRTSVTAYNVAKFELLGISSIKTVKNMVLDGRIKTHEAYTDKNGKLHITSQGLKRLIND